MSRKPAVLVPLASVLAGVLAAAAFGVRWLRRRRALLAPLEPLQPHPPEVVVRNRVVLRLDLLASQARDHGAPQAAERLEQLAAEHATQTDTALVSARAEALLAELRADPAVPQELRELLVLPPDLATAPVG